MSRNKKTVCIAICSVVALILVGVIAQSTLHRGSKPPADETENNVTDTTESPNSGAESTVPNIPDIKPDDTGKNDQKPIVPGDVTLDVLKGDETNKRSDSPKIEGEVVIISGAKGENE